MAGLEIDPISQSIVETVPGSFQKAICCSKHADEKQFLNRLKNLNGKLDDVELLARLFGKGNVQESTDEYEDSDSELEEESMIEAGIILHGKLDVCPKKILESVSILLSLKSGCHPSY